ncbi:unnamed protein product [Gongylonema pulchrum]|uniref:Serine/threonine-protein phosphatase n=1 Tax=Gongylonema pulchrum TaxID=637853 RepID=A0A3P7M203_9BILA|nr:unnamed protein product [Gongylonema pulchrum]
MLRIYDKNGFPPDSNYLFLGDFVDRGKQNIETICLQFCYKIKYPENFFMLRGNHETSAINRVYGFFEECNRRYHSTRLWNTFQAILEILLANTRGASYTFGQDVVVDVCQKLDLDLIARAHQVVQDGYEFFANRRLVTIFSAPHYCGQFDNAGGTMTVSEEMNCSFQVGTILLAAQLTVSSPE